MQAVFSVASRAITHHEGLFPPPMPLAGLGIPFKILPSAVLDCDLPSDAFAAHAIYLCNVQH